MWPAGSIVLPGIYWPVKKYTYNLEVGWGGVGVGVKYYYLKYIWKKSFPNALIFFGNSQIPPVGNPYIGDLVRCGYIAGQTETGSDGITTYDT